MYRNRVIKNKRGVIFYHVKKIEFSNNPYALLSTKLSKQIVVKLLLYLN